MDAKRKMVGFILFISLALTALAESPPVKDSAIYVKPKPLLCPENEERRCRNPCPPETCVTLYAAFLCIQNQTCVDGCYCKEGFLRVGPKGPCVPRDQCNPVECVNDPNAERGCGDKCGLTCADYNTNPICPKRPCRNDGCACKEGYIYDQNLSICVEPKKCTKPCKANERYSTCLLSECVPKTCADVGKSVACPAIAADHCRGGCICDYGYVKDKDGNCIDAETCPPNKCGNNEEFYCGPSCPDSEASCSNPNPPICINKRCELKCFCKKGFVRDANNNCILPSKCPKQCKGPHEIYIDCPAGQCNPKTCDDLVTPPGCPRIIPPCPGGCVCEDGYLRNSKGICIKKEQCPSMQCKKPHERYSVCLLGECVPKTCDDVGYPVPCPDIIGPCAGGCTCEEGFVRDCNGDCIDMKKCPCCGGDPNAVSGCGNPCGKTCASLYANKSDLVCPEYCQYNGCDCKPGFLLLESNNTDSSKCVPKSECPKPPKCKGPHEKYIDCPARHCIAKTCKDLIVPFPCPLVIPPCPGGCICEDGYLRDSNGICIKKEQCPSVCKDPNASWTDCMDACPRTCQNTNPGCVNVRCSAGCQCNTGYVLSEIGGKCVKIEECTDYANCCANQTFVYCTFKCPQVMCPKSDQILLCKPPRDCPGGCGCKPYYRYNATGDCIKASDCPPVECTGANQEWTSCQRISDWERCDDRYNSPPINPGDPDDCTPKCVCKKGYWRNDANECVSENECPPIKP